MDIGLIILFIMISIIGNIMKESKKQGSRRNIRETRTNNTYTDHEQKRSTFSEYKPPERGIGSGKVQNGGYQFPGGLNDLGPFLKKTVESIGRELTDSVLTMEGKRNDIGRTYESQEMPSLSPDRMTLEDSGLENTEVIHPSYEDDSELLQKRDSREQDSSEHTVMNQSVNLRFDKDSLINSIIMSEVLSPPKSRR